MDKSVEKCYFLHPGIEIYCDERVKMGTCKCCKKTNLNQMDKFITDTEKEFDEKFYWLYGKIIPNKKIDQQKADVMTVLVKYHADELKQFLKSKLQEAYIKGQVDIIKMSYAETLERIKKELKQQLIEKIEEQEARGYEPKTILESVKNDLRFNIIKEI